MFCLCHCIPADSTVNYSEYVAIFIALLALGVSLWSQFSQRKHNRKSVLPAGHIQLDDSLHRLQIQIVNKGCGPMKIIDFTADRNGIKHKNIIYHLPESLVPDDRLQYFKFQTHTEPEGYWLLPGDELILLKIEGDKEDPIFIEKREIIRSILCEITTHLTYADVYGKTHPEFSKSLDWYKRTV